MRRWTFLKKLIHGYRPTSDSSFRKISKSGLLNWSSLIVASPILVFAIISPSSVVKCSSQIAVLGLNKGIYSFEPSRIVTKSDPLC